MSRKRGRPARPYRIRVRTIRRTPIDYDALARAALEQAAMNQSPDEEGDIEQPVAQRPRRGQRRTTRSKDPRRDRLA